MSKTKIRVISVLVLTLAGFGVAFGYGAYQINLKQLALEQDVERIDNMNEYEVCQYALKGFGMKMVEDMGCLKPH